MPKSGEKLKKVKIYHGTGFNFDAFKNDIAWFAFDKKVADSYRKRSTIRKQAHEAGVKVGSVLLFDAGNFIEELAEAAGLNLEGGRIIEKTLPEGKQLDLTNRPSKIDSVPLWKILKDEGAYDVARSKGYETVKIKDIGIDGKDHDSIAILNPKKL